MNRVVVIRAAAGLAAYLHEQGETGPVVVGFDARHRSDDFARDTAEVMSGAGFKAWVLPRPLPTPVLAFAIRELGCVGRRDGHREPQPAPGQRLQGLPRRRQPDRAAGRRRDRGPDRRGRRGARRAPRPAAATVLGEHSSTATSTPSPSSPRTARATSTSSTRRCTAWRHVGAPGARDGRLRAPRVVEQQEQPDPDFPTVAFPNPEEPGAMDLALALAAEHDADLVLANDPDADRCAVAVPTGDTAGGCCAATRSARCSRTT